MDKKEFDIALNKIEIVNHPSFLEYRVFSARPKELPDYIKLALATIFVPIMIYSDRYLFSNLLVPSHPLHLPFLTRDMLTLLEVIFAIFSNILILEAWDKILLCDNPVELAYTLKIATKQPGIEEEDGSDPIYKLKHIGWLHSEDETVLNSLNTLGPSEVHNLNVFDARHGEEVYLEGSAGGLLSTPVFVTDDDRLSPVIPFQDYRSSDGTERFQMLNFRRYMFSKLPNLRGIKEPRKVLGCYHGYIKVIG